MATNCIKCGYWPGKWESRIKCICGSVYCSETCQLGDTHHYLLCDADFHMRMRKTIMLVNMEGYFINNICSPQFILKQRQPGGWCNAIASFRIFHPSVKDFGCVICGMNAKEQARIISPARLRQWKCTGCTGKNLCQYSYLPTEKCTRGANNRLFRLYALMCVWFEDLASRDVIRYIFAYAYAMDVDVMRLQACGIIKCKCI